MKAYRYNTEKREDRGYNRTGVEKNPNNVKFYAKTLEYADKYKYIYSDAGELVDECTMEVAEVDDTNLFDMVNNFRELNSYKNYIFSTIELQKKDYTFFMNKAKKARERKMWASAIDNLKNREEELVKGLLNQEFQQLSDFEAQNELVSELKGLGYNGYKTTKEIALF